MRTSTQVKQGITEAAYSLAQTNEPKMGKKINQFRGELVRN